MIDREAFFKEWVRQRPAPPNVQYLRDEERAAALDQLGHRTTVLDVASESRVTAELDAEVVTRVDFSADAAAYASDILGDRLDHSVVTSPESPILPFAEDEFDAAISIGPFDWKFLDVETLVRELHRAVDDLFVFSVPTPRSPYSTDRRNRFYEPEEALGLVSPDWFLRDHDQLFQYPGLVNSGVNRLPATVQEPFVGIERTISDLLTARDAWNSASYLVLGVQPLDYERYLEEAVACLFRPTDEMGFWDDDEGKIVRAWEYEFDGEGLAWTLDDSVQWRYAPFALAGALQWRISTLGTARYDGKIRRVLAYYASEVADVDTLSEMPSYGLGPLIVAFSLASRAFGEESYLETARTLYEYTAPGVEFTHAEDSLLLYGWTYLYETAGGEDVLEDLLDGLWKTNERLTSEGLFEFENPTSRRHQNQMYALWGLCRAIEVTGSDGFLSTAERVLDYTVDHRMRDDGAFIWEDLTPLEIARARAGRTLRGGNGRPPYWEFLYACHQTFFVNAVEHYYAAGGATDHDRAVRLAMEWIYGHNSRDVDLVAYSGLGVPMRFVLTDGRMDVPDQQYKGAYEIGSYVMALTNLRTGALASDRGTHRSQASAPTDSSPELRRTHATND